MLKGRVQSQSQTESKGAIQAKIDALHKMDGDHSKMKKIIKKELHKEEHHDN